MTSIVAEGRQNGANNKTVRRHALGVLQGTKAMKKMVLFGMVALVALAVFEFTDYPHKNLGSEEFYEQDNSSADAYRDAYLNDEIEFSSEEFLHQVCENYDKFKYGGECDIYKNSEGQIIARCNGENCVVMKLRKPFVTRVTGVGTITMYYKAGPYYMVSSPDYSSIFSKW